MEDKTLPDMRSFLIKILPIQPLAEATEMLEEHLNCQFQLVHGTTMARLEAEIKELDNQLVSSKEALRTLEKQKGSTPRFLKKSAWYEDGGNNA